MDGQKLNQDNAIPPRKADDEPAANDARPNDKPEESLIDFGGDDTPPAQTPVKKPDIIEDLLSSTGKPAEGPLIDFTQEMKKDLPQGNSKA